MRRHPRKKVERLPRRGADRLEDGLAWLLMLAALLTAGLAVVTGVGVTGNAAARAEREAADRTSVSATVLQDAPGLAGSPDTTASARVRADVSWTVADGTARTARALVPPASRAGEIVTIWLDRAGNPVDQPNTAANAPLAGIAAGFVVLLGGALLLALSWLGVRYWTNTLKDRGWEREWARVGPEWTGHGRHDAGKAAD